MSNANSVKNPGDLLQLALRAEQSGRQDEALRHYQSLISIDASHPGARLRVAQLQRAIGRNDEAINLLRRAIAGARRRGMASQTLPIHTELIIALRRGSANDRLTACRDAQRDCGEVPGLLWEECECLRELGMRQDRLARLNRLAALQPNDRVILAELGRALLGSNSHKQAHIPLREAYRLGERSPSFLVALANAEISAHDLARAEAALDEALRIEPKYFAAIAARCNVAHRSCDFTTVARFEPTFVALANQLTSHGAIDVSVAPFLLLATDVDAITLRNYSVRYCEQRLDDVLRHAAHAVAPRALGSRRIRVGYLTGDFHGHAVSILTAGMFEKADRSRFENFALSHGPRVENEYRLRLRRAFEHWIDLNELNDGEAADAIAALNLDVLIDLKGTTNGSRPRIVARRPAPIQVHYLAYPATLGLPGIDYYVGDETTIPAGAEHEFTEKIIRLPGCFFPNDDRREHPSPPSRTSLGLPEHAFVLCNFNQTWKLREAFVRCWLSALAKHKHAVLWLGDPGSDHPSRKNLFALANEYGVADRLIWANYPTLTEHLARLAQADLAVDQCPYNSHTTAADALWMGVPVLTCLGERFDGRVAASLLKAAGAEEWIAKDFDDYVQKLDRALADSTPNASQRVRDTDKFVRTELFDTEGFTRKWEAMLSELVERHASGAA
jgi:protein O-GlcNAc transferase